MAENEKQTAQPRPATRPEHSEAYWQAMKYLIIGLGALMILAVALAVIVVLRIIPWS